MGLVLGVLHTHEQILLLCHVLGTTLPYPASRQACIEVVPSNPANFNVDNVRVVKIPGGGAADARVVRGLVIKRGAEGAVQSAADAKVAVFAQGVDTSSTETKASCDRPPSVLAGLRV